MLKSSSPVLMDAEFDWRLYQAIGGGGLLLCKLICFQVVSPHVLFLYCLNFSSVASVFCLFPPLQNMSQFVTQAQNIGLCDR